MFTFRRRPQSCQSPIISPPPLAPISFCKVHRLVLGDLHKNNQCSLVPQPFEYRSRLAILGIQFFAIFNYVKDVDHKQNNLFGKGQTFR